MEIQKRTTNVGITLPEAIIAAENGRLEDDRFLMAYFMGYVSFREGNSLMNHILKS